MEYKDPGRYIPIIYLLYSWGVFGVPSTVPLSLKGGLLYNGSHNILWKLAVVGKPGMN